MADEGGGGVLGDGGGGGGGGGGDCLRNGESIGSGQYSPRADGLQDVSVSRRGGKREKFDVTYAASSGHCAPFIPLLPLALGACY